MDLENFEEHPENIFAKNNRGEDVFINNCPSGRKGYYCLGCGREMQAVRFKIDRYKSYFRHDYEYTMTEKKCTYSSETYRHKLAKDQLQLTKQIKVPQLLKFHPTDINALAIRLKDAEVVEASKVHIEMPFFENESGEIAWGRNSAFPKERLLIQPDVAFFNALGEPILLIEIVATNKISDEKRAKIRRLGINTVQITIPKDSPEAIVESLKSSQKVKWVFHNEEAQADYLQLSESNTETVSYPDAEQRKLLGETLSCREAEIRRLIYSINQCLQSEQYTSTRTNLDFECARVEEFTEQQKNELVEFEEKCRVELSERYRVEQKRIEEACRSEIATIRAIEFKQADLESRYLGKKAEFGDQLFETEGQIADIGRSSDSKEAEIERETRAITGIINSEELVVRDIERVLNGNRYSINELESKRKSLSEVFGKKEADFINYLQREEETIAAEFERDEKQLRARIEQRKNEIKLAFERGNVKGGIGVPDVVKRVISEFEFLRVIATTQPDYKRVSTAYKTIGDRTYKDILARYNR